jgi:tyrosyl-tRNA synthetase
MELLSRKSKAEREGLQKAVQQGTENPMEVKKAFAFEIVERLCGRADADEAKSHFEKTVQKREVPDDVEEIDISKVLLEKSAPKFLQEIAPQASASAAFRLVEQGGLIINDQKITDTKKPLKEFSDLIRVGNEGNQMRIGKRRWIRFRVIE